MAIIFLVVQKATAFAMVDQLLLLLTNTLAFHVTKLITAIISFMIQAPDFGTLYTFVMGATICLD
jgi:hypothetical protein